MSYRSSGRSNAISHTSSYGNSHGGYNTRSSANSHGSSNYNPTNHSTVGAQGNSLYNSHQSSHMHTTGTSQRMTRYNSTTTTYKPSSHQSYKQGSTTKSTSENPTRRLMVHLTDPQAAASILQSNMMRPGTGGLLGAGIYFCKTMDGCDWRALHSGTYILAEVYLGKTEADVNLDTKPDHVTSTVSGTNLPMYVVNDPTRVKNIRYLDGTLPPNTDVNNIQMRDRMPLIFVASPQDAANYIAKKMLPVENRPEIAGKGFYLWKNIPDAKKFAKGDSSTYLAADVYFNNCFEGKNGLPKGSDLNNFSSFRGKFKGTYYFMVKNPADVVKIHYIGGVRPPPPH